MDDLWVSLKYFIDENCIDKSLHDDLINIISSLDTSKIRKHINKIFNRVKYTTVYYYTIKNKIRDVLKNIDNKNKEDKNKEDKKKRKKKIPSAIKKIVWNDIIDI